MFSVSYQYLLLLDIFSFSVGKSTVELKEINIKKSIIHILSPRVERSKINS